MKNTNNEFIIIWTNLVYFKDNTWFDQSKNRVQNMENVVRSPNDNIGKIFQVPIVT